MTDPKEMAALREGYAIARRRVWELINGRVDLARSQGYVAGGDCGWLYLIAVDFATGRFVKAGFSANPHKRCYDQCGRYPGAELVGLAPGQEWHEKLFHRQMRWYRSHLREWYFFHPSILRAFQDLAAKNCALYQIDFSGAPT